VKYVLVSLNATEKCSSYLTENTVRVCYKQLHKELIVLDCESHVTMRLLRGHYAWFLVLNQVVHIQGVSKRALQL